MARYWYAIPCQNEVGEYIEEGELNNFPRGTFLAYHNCCLVTGLSSKDEALEWNRTHTCNRKTRGK